MHWLRHYFLFSCIPYITLALGKVEPETSDIENVCYNSTLEGFRLNTTVFKDTVVSQRIDCILECATELCCRSINFKKTFKNESNCEMLHDVVFNTSAGLLETNSSFDHVHLVNPQKIYNASCLPKTLETNFQVPISCKHIQANGTTQDGEFELYVKWPNNTRPAKIYCADMDTENPAEYITLPAGEINNYARHFNKHEKDVKEETYFRKVRILLENMTIGLDDYKFASTNAPGVFHQFASAGDCVSTNCDASFRTGKFQVDLSGTSFRMLEPIQYQFSNYPICNRKVFDPVMEENRQRWSGKCGGFCGNCSPVTVYLEITE